MYRRSLCVVLIAAGAAGCAHDPSPDVAIGDAAIDESDANDVSVATSDAIDSLDAVATDTSLPRPYLPIAAFPPLVEPSDNPTSPARVALGLQLFHDPALSRDHTVACVTCHGEIWGLSDGLPLSIGIGGIGPPGPGRYGPTHTQRNASTLWNAGYRAGLFWDGRAASLEAQVAFPMHSAIEMARDPDLVADDLRGYPAYASLFAAAFPGESQPITAANVARAVAAFERTLVTDHAPFDHWVQGHARAMSVDEVRGWSVFNEIGCASCHVPPLFESERYESSFAPALSDTPDEGRFDATGIETDRGRFRVPTLRNLRFTGPYFHNGTVVELPAAVSLEVQHRATRAIDAGELAALVMFLQVSVVDITRTPDRPRIAPSGLAVPTDTLEIPRWRTDAGQD